MTVILRRKRKKRSRARWMVPVTVTVLVVVVGGWLWLRPMRLLQAAPGDGTETATETASPQPTPGEQPPAEDVRLAGDTQVEQVLIPGGDSGLNEWPAEESAVTPPPTGAESTTMDDDPLDDPTAARAEVDTASGNRTIELARQLYEKGERTAARQRLNTLLAQSNDAREQTEIRAILKRWADEMIFSREIIDNDPLMESYTIESGDRLVRIGQKYDVPYEAIMQVNGITDARRIRVGQRIKVLHGPFHVKIDKSAFRMDVYLRDVYVRSYRVGLGSENGTPEGTWRVKERLPNPTYYPPASASDKRIIPPGDPRNPLGEHWIGLAGIAGDTVGREGYGIHGTIEPESIGKAVSLGCIRMHNADVGQLYNLLMPGKSQVTIIP
jgi:lipoprotein-anchoring transpeptidase ErfK/SrfK